jgi:hypothetical protein
MPKNNLKKELIDICILVGETPDVLQRIIISAKCFSNLKYQSELKST